MYDIFDSQESVRYIKTRIGDRPLRLGLILGSGLGEVASLIDDPIDLSYREIPGFPQGTIAGHANRLMVGTIASLPVVCYQGRSHVYEGDGVLPLITMILTLRDLGCSELFITNSAGSLNPNIEVGSLMMITDHINFQGINPLVGIDSVDVNSRFVAMDHAYDSRLQKKLLKVAKDQQIILHQGVYIAVLGPSFETPAEVRAFRHWGADAVGMSTVPEVILARYAGLRVVAVSIVTNLACGLTEEKLTHEGTLKAAQNTQETLMTLIQSFCHHSHSQQE